MAITTKVDPLGPDEVSRLLEPHYLIKAIEPDPKLLASYRGGVDPSYLQNISPETLKMIQKGDREESPEQTEFRAMLDQELAFVRDMLLRKNRAYGNSALNPLRIFSRADKLEGIRVRIDDKLNRLMQGTADDEDVVLDLLGYLLIYRIAAQEICPSGK